MVADRSSDSRVKSEPFDVASSLDFYSDVPLTLRAIFGQTSVTIGRLLELKKGSVLTFDGKADSSITLLANGNPVATGEVVVVNEHFGVRITSITDRIEG